MRTSLLRPLYFHSLPRPPIRHRHVSLRLRCASSDSEEAEPTPRGTELLAGLVGERVEELLKKEENRGLVEKLDEASRRVERARAELAGIKKQREEVRRANEYIKQLENQQAEIAESINELEEARAMVDQAEQSLSPNFNGEINRDRERLESIKAGAISSFVGTLASLPITLAQATDLTQVFVQSIVVLVSCGLFGVTFRYAVRRDLDDVQLKTGTAAAFGFVKGLATLEAGKSLELSTDGLISFSIGGGISIAQNVFIFLFSAVALDFCIKTRLLSPFPMKE